ncbi:9796_t:CDS:1 [Diversispora eburnea]|uniref:9796_t:CDS:1 n=1 Tax=Diversispora eburnea TaxID=1213867 RepID=A0A9N8VAD3_9GLOM|nr:9796_t:CDS:1 [Diversispora eburnea]
MVDAEKIPNKSVFSIDGEELDFVTGIPYKISNKKNYIDNWDGDHGSQPCLSSENHPPDHPKYLRQLWVFKESSHSRKYKILSIGNRNYLDSWGGRNEAKLYMNSTNYPSQNPCYLRQLWSFHSTNNWLFHSKESQIQIHNENNNCFLDTWGKSSYIYFCSNFNSPFSENFSNQVWKFIRTSDYELNAAISNFNFSSDTKCVQITKNIRKDTLDNLASSAKLTTTFNLQEEFTNTYKFRFNESLDFISETKLIFVIPFMDIEKELNFKYSFEANKPITTITKETCTINKTVEVPPKSRVEITDFADFRKSVEMTFKATVEVTATGDRYKNDGSIIKNTKVDADAVNLFLKENNFQGKIISSEGNSVIAEVHGTFSGSYVTKTHRKLEDVNI